MSAARVKFSSQPKRLLWALPVLALSLALTLSVPRTMRSNQGGNSGGITHGVHNIPPDPSDTLTPPIAGGIDPLFQERRLRQLAMETHKQMVSDTNKLLQLVTELSSEINVSNPRSFTPDQLHKIAQIEKLAHSVKEKMGNTMLGVPANMQASPEGQVFHH